MDRLIGWFIIFVCCFFFYMGFRIMLLVMRVIFNRGAWWKITMIMVMTLRTRPGV